MKLKIFKTAWFFAILFFIFSIIKQNQELIMISIMIILLLWSAMDFFDQDI